MTVKSSYSEFHPSAEGRVICYQGITHTAFIGLVNVWWAIISFRKIKRVELGTGFENIFVSLISLW